MQFSSLEERIALLEQFVIDERKCEQLKKIFQMKPINISDIENIEDLPEEYKGMYAMAKGLRYITNVDVYFDPGDLHSIEILDNYALRFRTTDGIALGDGGEYSNYANRWNNKIRSFWSVASGVEAIERNSPDIVFEDIQRKIALCSLDASPNFILKVIKELEDRGEFVTYKGKFNNIGKAIKKVKDEYSHVSFLGEREENGSDIQVKALTEGESFTIPSPNKKYTLSKATKDEEER